MRMKFWRSSNRSEDNQKDLAKRAVRLRCRPLCRCSPVREIATDPFRQICGALSQPFRRRIPRS